MKHVPRRFRKHYYRDRAEGKRLARDIAAMYAKAELDALTIFGKRPL